MGHPVDHPSVDSEARSVEAAQIEEVLRAFTAALRSFRLYQGGNPMLDRFVDGLRQRLAKLWESLPLLQLRIEEDRILWEGDTVFLATEPTSDLPFLLYKDGIRELTLLPAVEEEEIERVLAVLARAPSLKQEHDDLTTLLWQEDFARLRYRAVEVGAESVDLPGGEGNGEGPEKVDAGAVRAAASEPSGLTTEDFQETLHFLDPAELRRLREEIERENERDLWADVLNALLDRIEDGSPERQVRIVGLFGELLPSALATAEFGRAAALLQQLVDLASRPGVLGPTSLREVRSLFDNLGSEATVLQLAEILEEMPERLGDPTVLQILRFLPPHAIGSLMSAAERLQRPEVKRAFEGCVQRIAETNRDSVVELLDSEDPAVLAGALRWVGRLDIGTALSNIVRFLGHPEPEVRVAAAEAMVSLRAAAAAKGLIPLLQDVDRRVRIAAARALGALSYVQGRAALESAIAGKRLREADRSEKVAFFEAFGRLAGPDGVPLLDRILNTRSWLGRGEPAELRASAALALAKIRHPSARESLSSAQNDPDPVVRSTVARALRGEAVQ
jgi:hypothetical protein